MGYVYFIEAEESGLIKIGRAADPGRRLAAMQTGSAEPLRLLRTIATDDDKTLERTFHRRFAGSRHHGEWFEPSPGLTKFAGAADQLGGAAERRRLADLATAKLTAWRAEGGCP